MSENKTNYAGDVEIMECMIISRSGAEFDIRNLVVEINLFESIFASSLSGNILIADGSDIINVMEICGEELIRLRIRTPNFDESEEIWKTFKVYAISNKTAAMTDRSQTFILHFISQEGFLDSVMQISGTFSGNVTDVVSNLYNKYVELPRNIIDGVESKNTTELVLLDQTRNTITFNSPNWSPFRCINYVTSRALRTDNDGSNFVFYETNKSFVFGSIQELIDIQMKSGFLFENYIYMQADTAVPDPSSSNFAYKKPTLDYSYRLVEDFTVVEDFNLLSSNNVGHLSNRTITFDVIKKNVSVFDYDYLTEYKKYKHVDLNSVSKNGMPVVSDRQLRSSKSQITIYPKHPGLFDNRPNTTNDEIEKILSSRISLLADISSRKLLITVPGRTDVECGMLIYFRLPAFKSKDIELEDEKTLDKFYSGVYIITAIRHKISPQKHVILLEICKDSTERK